MVTDDTQRAASGETTTPWLSPSEALTRFVPSRRRQAARDLAPTRFGFRIGDIGLLVPAGMHSELVEETEVYPLPTTPAWLRGLINLRGGLVPVFDLRALFSMEEGGGAAPHLLVLNREARAVGVLIDGLPLSVDTGQRLPQSPPLPALLREHSHAVYVQHQEIWVEFDFDGFFQVVGSRVAA